MVTRAAGAACWRIYLQHMTPQAHRLHFWQLPKAWNCPACGSTTMSGPDRTC